MNPATSSDTDWILVHIWVAALAIDNGSRFFMICMMLLCVAHCVLNSVQAYLTRRSKP